MAKKPKRKKRVAIGNIAQRTADNEEVAAMLGTRGKRHGKSNLTLREERAIRNSKRGNLEGLTEKQKMALYRKTKKAQDERKARAAASKRR